MNSTRSVVPVRGVGPGPARLTWVWGPVGAEEAVKVV
jgi:hypothetical protein